MAYSDKNILTPDFYNFISSNKAMYGQAIMQQIHDAAEKVNISSDERESLAVVLSGAGVGITAGVAKKLGLPNMPEIVMRQQIPRRKVRFRSVDSRFYSAMMQDFTGWIKSPFETGISNAERSSRISLHPFALTLLGYFETNPMPYGTLVMVKQIEDEFFITQNISKPIAKWSRDKDSNPYGGTWKDTGPIDLTGWKTTKGMKPLFVTDGKESYLTREGAQNNMNGGTLSRYETMLSILGFEVTVNDAIAKSGTSRETERQDSQHFFGRALDLSIRGKTDEQRIQMVDAASRAGFKSMGFGVGILHVDWGTRPRAWPYKGTGKYWGGKKYADLYNWVKAGGYAAKGSASLLADKV